MTETIENYAHLIEIDAQTRVLTIHRVRPDGKKQFYTSTDIPDIAVTADEDGYQDFARLLGEAILMDSPAARDLFGL
jgi:hypothetical protein